jgi:hypothetical protein
VAKPLGNLPARLKSPAGGEVANSAMRGGEMAWIVSTASGRSRTCPPPFRSNPMPARPPSRASSSVGDQMPCCCATSATVDRTSGPMANEKPTTRPRVQDRKFHCSVLVRGRTSGGLETLTVRGGKGEPDRQSGSQIGLLGTELTTEFYARESPFSRRFLANPREFSKISALGSSGWLTSPDGQSSVANDGCPRVLWA